MANYLTDGSGNHLTDGLPGPPPPQPSDARYVSFSMSILLAMVLTLVP